MFHRLDSARMLMEPGSDLFKSHDARGCCEFLFARHLGSWGLFGYRSAARSGLKSLSHTYIST